MNINNNVIPSAIINNNNDNVNFQKVNDKKEEMLRKKKSTSISTKKKEKKNSVTSISKRKVIKTSDLLLTKIAVKPIDKNKKGKKIKLQNPNFSPESFIKLMKSPENDKKKISSKFSIPNINANERLIMDAIYNSKIPHKNMIYLTEKLMKHLYECSEMIINGIMENINIFNDRIKDLNTSLLKNMINSYGSGLARKFSKKINDKKTIIKILIRIVKNKNEILNKGIKYNSNSSPSSSFNFEYSLYLRKKKMAQIRDLFVFPFEGINSVIVTTEDEKRLISGKMFNDNLIEFCIKWLETSILTKDQKEDVHFFNSFFFDQLCSRKSLSPNEMYESVKKWTSKVDIFDRKYIFIPINESMHWYLMMIYNPAAYLVKEDEGKTSNDILDSVNTDVAMDSVDVDSHIDSNNEVNEINTNDDPTMDELSTMNEHTNSCKDKYTDNEDEISLINAVNELMIDSIDDDFDDKVKDLEKMLLNDDTMIIDNDNYEDNNDNNNNDNNDNNNDNNNSIDIITNINNKSINNSIDININNNDNNNKNTITSSSNNDDNNNNSNCIDIDFNKNKNDNNNNNSRSRNINSNINSTINDDNNKKNENNDYKDNDNNNTRNNNGGSGDKNDDIDSNDNNVIIISINDNNSNNNNDNDNDGNKNIFDNPIKIESDTSSLIESSKVLDDQSKSSSEKIYIKEENEVTKNEISIIESINVNTNKSGTNKLSKSNSSNSLLPISSSDIKEINEEPQIEIDDEVQLGTKPKKSESRIIPINNKNNKSRKQTRNEVTNANNADTEEKKENPNIKVLLSDAHSLKVALDEKNLDNSNCILERFKQLIIRELALKMINFLKALIRREIKKNRLLESNKNKNNSSDYNSDNKSNKKSSSTNSNYTTSSKNNNKSNQKYNPQFELINLQSDILKNKKNNKNVTATYNNRYFTRTNINPDIIEESNNILESLNSTKDKFKKPLSKDNCYIIIFDSINGKHPTAAKIINSYLTSEAYHKKDVVINKKIRCLYAKVPKQSNSLDCGVYLIKYIETFLQNPDKYMDMVLVSKRDDSEWFSKDSIKKKREDIRDLIIKLTEEYKVKMEKRNDKIKIE